MKVKKKTLIREEFRRRGQWLDGECCRMTEGRVRKMKKKRFGRGEKAHPAVRRYLCLLMCGLRPGNGMLE